METRKVFTSKKIFDYLKIAAKIARPKCDIRTFFHGSVGVRKDGAWVFSRNGSNKIPDPTAHAETRLARKLDVGSVVYIVRVRTNGDFAKSAPCDNCRRVLKNRGVKRVYYSISNNEYGILDLN